MKYPPSVTEWEKRVLDYIEDNYGIQEIGTREPDGTLYLRDRDGSFTDGEFDRDSGDHWMLKREIAYIKEADSGVWEIYEDPSFPEP